MLSSVCTFGSSRSDALTLLAWAVYDVCAGLLARLDLTADEFRQLLDRVRFYRDKFVAHLDELNEMTPPTLDLLAKVIWFYRAHIVTKEVQPGDFGPYSDRHARQV